jgi:putative spermidine/putrescine transport system permease protein
MRGAPTAALSGDSGSHAEDLRSTGKRRFVSILWSAVRLGAYIAFAAFFVIDFIWPLLLVISKSFGSPPWHFYETNLTNKSVLTILWRTVRMAATVSIVCLVFAYPTALALTRLNTRSQGLMLLLILLPAVTPFLVRTYGWIAILGANGPLSPLLRALDVQGGSLVGTFAGLIVAMVHMLLPLMILPIFAAMRTIPLNQIAAAKSLGASPLEAFLRVFLPQSISGVIAGSVLVFVVALGFFITPALIGGMRETTLPMIIFMYMNELFDWGSSTSLAIILVIVVVVMLAIAAQATNIWKAYGLPTEDNGRSGFLAKPVLNFLSRLARWAARYRLFTSERSIVPSIALWLTLIILLLPLFFVVAVSFQPQRLIAIPTSDFSLRWYQVVLSSRSWVDAAVTSLEIAVLASAIALVIGYAAAVFARRVSPGVRNLLCVIFLGPQILPLIVLAVGLYGVFIKLDWIGVIPAVALAHAGVAVPYVFVNVLNGLAKYNSRLDAAAASLGARGFTILRRVRLPLLFPSIAAGAAFAFLTSLDELVITLFVAGSDVRTLPMVMYGAAIQDLSPQLAVVGSLLIALVVGGGLLGRAVSSRLKARGLAAQGALA